jgi:hypothetical protein
LLLLVIYFYLNVCWIFKACCECLLLFWFRGYLMFLVILFFCCVHILIHWGLILFLFKLPVLFVALGSFCLLEQCLVSVFNPVILVALLLRLQCVFSFGYGC